MTVGLATLGVDHTAAPSCCDRNGVGHLADAVAAHVRRSQQCVENGRHM